MSACTDARGNWFIVVCSISDYPDTTSASTFRPLGNVPGKAAAGEVLPAGGTPPAEDSTPAAPGGMELRAAVYMLVREPALRDRIKETLRRADVDVRGVSRVSECLAALERGTAGCLIVEAAARPDDPDSPATLFSRSIPAPVIVVTEGDDWPTAIRAVRNGAFDVIEQRHLDHQLVDTVLAALDNRRQWLDNQQAKSEVQRRYAALTPREREVFRLAATGHRSRAIAARLGIREKTVEVYRSRVNHKMNAHNAAELAQMLHLMEP